MKPELAVSMGDPAGIGPEILVRAAASPAVRRACSLVAYGDENVLEAARRLVGRSAGGEGAVVAVRQCGRRRRTLGPSTPGAAAGRAAFAALDVAARAVADGLHAGLVTAPINKLSMQRAGHDYDGHTGYLSELTGCTATMMLAGRRLRVVLVTTHIALAQVAGRLNSAAIESAALTTIDHLGAFHGLRAPKLAVAALNPHAGEGGLFGDEESRIIAPAVKALTRAGHRVRGPLPADTLFATAVAGNYDAVVCMYHDQALIPLKLTEFGRSVNITMGLPFIRTSPDHGTAHDIAWTGHARPESMIAAILLAAKMARRVAEKHKR
jgi:4-hydroxythreonine-4-phosphate dehydrogenase